ncbi:MAG: TSUP family transporter [Pirellulaceae bacterium]
MFGSELTLGDVQIDDFIAFLADPQTWGSICVLTLSSVIQASFGFAAALFGMPLLLWLGNDLMSSQVMIISAMLPQNILGLYRLRKSLDLREVVGPACLRISALPLGILCMVYVISWTPARVNQLVGVILLLAVVAQLFVGFEWKSAKRWYWQVATFGGSGFLQGLSGMSGPPLVMWVHGQRYAADRARAFLFAIFISNFLPQVCLLWWRFGNDVWIAVGTAVAALPTVLGGAILGLRLGSRLGDTWLRPLSYGLLLALAVSSLLSPWLRGE